MEQERLTKLSFFVGYNYFIRYCNIKRKIQDFEKNAKSLQNVINEKYHPLLFQGGKISKDGKEIFDIKNIKSEIKTKPLSDSQYKKTFEKKFNSIPYTEEGKYFIIVDIISETTQYCADLASVIIGLRDFNTDKSTFSQIKDAVIKDWFQDLNQPTIKDCVDIFNLPSLNEMSPEERFHIILKHDSFLWNINKIGNYFWYNYDYLYTPFRHGMKVSFWQDSEGRIYCRTLTRDKKYNFYYISDEKVKKSEEIAEIIYSMFHNELNPVLISKAFPFVKDLRFKVPEAPKLPIRTFDHLKFKEEFNSLKNIKVHHFLIKDIAAIHKFAKNQEINFDFHYIKKKKGTSFFKIDGISHYLDTFFSFSKKINNEEYLIINSCPLGFFIELSFLSISSNPIHDIKISQIKESIFHYLTVEKYIDFIMEDPHKAIQRTNMLRMRTDEIIPDFIVLIGLYNNKEVFERLKIANEELDFIVYFYKNRLIRLLNSKNFMKKLYPDIILQSLLQILIISFFVDVKQIEYIVNELKVENFNTFLSKSSDLILKSVKKELDLQNLLKFMDYLYDTINIMQK